MPTYAHPALWILIVATAALMPGCVSQPVRTAQRIEPARDFEVVETSLRRPLTDREMVELRGSVSRYLDQHDATESGNYYVKVFLTPETPGAEPDWVVVRFTRYATGTYVASGSYAVGAYDYAPYYSYDLYPYGYDGFGRFAFQYYEDPFNRQRYYYYPRSHPGSPRRDHDRPSDSNHDRPRPSDWNHDGDHRNPPPGSGVASHPHGDRGRPSTPAANNTNWSHRPPPTSSPPRPETQNPRSDGRQWQPRPQGNQWQPRPESTSVPRASNPSYQPRPESAPQPRQYSPPPQQYSPPPQHYSPPPSADRQPASRDVPRQPDER